MIPPTPAAEADKDNFNFSETTNGTSVPDNTKSMENLRNIKEVENQRGSKLLFVPKLGNSRRLSIPVVLIPEDGKTDSKFNSSDNVYLENLYKAASVSSLGNFGSIAVEPMPIIKNKEGKWYDIFIQTKVKIRSNKLGTHLNCF